MPLAKNTSVGCLGSTFGPFWRHNLHMKAPCVYYGKSVLNLRVKGIIPMSRLGIGSNYQYWSIGTGFYRYWLLPVNSSTAVNI